MTTHSNHRFTVFCPEEAPEDLKVPLETGEPVLFGKGRIYLRHVLDEDEEWERKYQPKTFRLCIDGNSPLLHWERLGDGDYYYMLAWDIDTRCYPNGPHTLTAATWLYFHTGEGPSTTVEVFFDNPASELREPPLLPQNLNLPVPWPAKGAPERQTR